MDPDEECVDVLLSFHLEKEPHQRDIEHAIYSMSVKTPFPLEINYNNLHPYFEEYINAVQLRSPTAYFDLKRFKMKSYWCGMAMTFLKKHQDVLNEYQRDMQTAIETNQVQTFFNTLKASGVSEWTGIQLGFIFPIEFLKTVQMTVMETYSTGEELEAEYKDGNKISHQHLKIISHRKITPFWQDFLLRIAPFCNRFTLDHSAVDDFLFLASLTTKMRHVNVRMRCAWPMDIMKYDIEKRPEARHFKHLEEIYCNPGERYPITLKEIFQIFGCGQKKIVSTCHIQGASILPFLEKYNVRLIHLKDITSFEGSSISVGSIKFNAKEEVDSLHYYCGIICNKFLVQVTSHKPFAVYADKLVIPFDY